LERAAELLAEKRAKGPVKKGARRSTTRPKASSQR
jgi:topoisomerase IA-like protein